MRSTLTMPEIYNARFLGTDARKLFVVCSAEPETYGPGDFEGPDSIQEALDCMGGTGGQVFARQGTYNKFEYTAEDQHVTGEHWFHTVVDGAEDGHAVTIADYNRCSLENIRLKTTAGGAGNCSCLVSAHPADYFMARKVYFHTSGYMGCQANGSLYWTFEGCVFASADDYLLYLPGAGLAGHTIRGCYFLPYAGTKNVVIHSTGITFVGNYVYAASTQVGVDITSGGDNSTVVGNYLQSAGGVGSIGVKIDATAENCIVMGNRIASFATGISDASGTSITETATDGDPLNEIT